MQRRDFLTTAPVLTVMPGTLLAFAASEETPISRLFAEWCRLHDHSNEPGISEDECNRRVDVEVAVEKEMQRLPPLTAQDFARKLLIEVGFGVFNPTREFWGEVCALAGVPPARMLI
ncbi:hypothetical protein [Xinfangfangia pollutisoli]|uniref:hypothetical protein n=1 Tax=Xinfangfangia pollutisoli TaxID=2865960 RepID=UPI001CD7621D|nr:hypothetical protein [Xinfangfangia pollutisoli]